MDRRKRRTFKIHRDCRGTPTLALRQFDMRDELFFVVFFHYCSCSTLIFPQQIFEICHFEWRKCGFLFWSRLVFTSVTDVCHRGDECSLYCTQVVFPSRRCPVTSICDQFDSCSIYGPLHRSLSALNTWSTTDGLCQWLSPHGSHRLRQIHVLYIQ